MKTARTIAVTLILLLSAFTKQSHAQFEHNQGIVFELGGTGGIYSINYEQRVAESRVRIRAGASYMGPLTLQPTGSSKIFTMPIAVLIEPKSNEGHFIYGPGMTIIRYSNYDTPSASTNWEGGGWDRRNFLFLTFRLGYRSKLSEDGLQFGVSLTPGYQFSQLNTKTFIPWAGISLGKAF